MHAVAAIAFLFPMVFVSANSLVRDPYRMPVFIITDIFVFDANVVACCSVKISLQSITFDASLALERAIFCAIGFSFGCTNIRSYTIDFTMAAILNAVRFGVINQMVKIITSRAIPLVMNRTVDSFSVRAVTAFTNVYSAYSILDIIL